MEAKQSVFIKRPGAPIRHVNMSLTLENLQRYVGGYIEVVRVGTFNDQEVVFICNEEGKLRGLETNFYLFGDFANDAIKGDVVFLQAKGEDLIGLEGDLREFRGWLQDQGLVFEE